MKTRDRIIALHKQGLANIEVAQIVGVSRQRVWEVLHPEARNRKSGVSASFRSASAGLWSGLLTTSRIAAILGVHPNTLRRWADEGLIPCLRLGQRHDRRFDPQLVMETIRKSDSRNS